jgi:hypothetical protein
MLELAKERKADATRMTSDPPLLPARAALATP